MAEPGRGWLRMDGACGHLSAQRLRPVRNGRQCMGMDDRLVPGSPQDQESLLHDRQPARLRSGAKLRSAHARHQGSEKSDEGRLVPVRAKLLPPLPPSRSHGAAGRYVDLSSRLSLHRARVRPSHGGIDGSAVARDRVLRGSRTGRSAGMETHGNDRVTSASSDAKVSTELASRRTGMSFHRTRLSADRTLMSVIRTSLSLIGFGFTIFQVFQKAHEAQILKSSEAPRHFGEALVWLGLAMLIVGIVYHVRFMLGLRSEREMLK